MKIRENVCFAISVLLHIAVFIAVMLAHGKGHSNSDSNDKLTKDRQAKNKYEGVKIKTVLEKEDKTEVEIVSTPPEKNPTIKKKIKKPTKPSKLLKTDDCPYSKYGGIGIAEDNGVIISVFRGYAAYKAGLLVGDQIIGVEGGQLLGTPGTTVNITVMRRGVIMVFTVTRCWVCY